MNTINRFLIKSDKICDWIPGISTVSNIIDGCQKIFRTHKVHSTLYQSYLERKASLRCFTLLFPGIGQLALIVYKVSVCILNRLRKPTKIDTSTPIASFSPPVQIAAPLITRENLIALLEPGAGLILENEEKRDQVKENILTCFDRKLLTLDLDNKRIIKLPTQLFYYFGNVHYIYLGRNCLNTLSSFAGTPDLLTLDCSFNRLPTIDRAALKIPSLCRIRSDNQAPYLQSM